MPRTNNKLNDYQKIEIVEKYLTQLYSKADLAKEYNVTIQAIFGLLKRRNIPTNANFNILKRKYSVNDNYFDTIDTEEKAYFLGWMYSDGYNSVTGNIIKLSIQITDIEILEMFKLALVTNKPIYIEKSKKTNRKDMACLSINSKRLSASLYNLGCFQKKSLILKFPTEDQVPSHLIRHFIRGMWDGDGGIYFIQNYNRKSYSFKASLTSTVNFCESLKFLLHNNLNIKSAIHYSNNKEKSTRVLTIGGNVEGVKFLNWLYHDSEYFLHRKYNTFLFGKDYLIENNILNEDLSRGFKSFRRKS